LGLHVQVGCQWDVLGDDTFVAPSAKKLDFSGIIVSAFLKSVVLFCTKNIA
jgi:hypothetical protein